MKKWLGFVAAVFAGSVPALAGNVQEMALERNGLHGTLSLPDGDGPFPAALIIAGSGPVDRDGNFPGGHNDGLKQLAHALGERGIATLRTDKRGIAQSANAIAREEDLRFSTYVDDAVEWVALLDADERLSDIYIIGHSEGALVGTLAAQKSEITGLLMIAGASFPAAQIIARQLQAASVPQEFQERSREIADALIAGEGVEDVPAELEPLYRQSVQPYLMSWLSIDPAAELANVNQPVLIVQGTTDLQVLPIDAQRLAEAGSGAELVLIEGMNHILKSAPEDRAANIEAYDNPDLPIHHELIEAVARFMTAR